MKQVLEPAGAAALAAVLSGAIPLRAGDRVCVILSGGNVAVERLGELLAMAAPLPAPEYRRVGPRRLPSRSRAREPVLVLDAQVVGELVQDRDPDLVGEVVRVAGSPPRAAAGTALIRVGIGTESAPHSERGTPSYRP